MQPIDTISKFHNYYKWPEEYRRNKDSWVRVFGSSDSVELSKSLKDWIDAQTGDFFKAPMPAAIRPYYTQRMETKRRIERENDSTPARAYDKLLTREINFSIVEDDQLRHRGEQILSLRASRASRGAYDHNGNLPGHSKAPMAHLADSIVAEYRKRFPTNSEEVK